MKVHLEDQHLALVKNILNKYELLANTFVFGSRARGDHKKYSDLDILIKGPKALQMQELVKLKNDFEESKLPIKVDIVDWCSIDDGFRSNIQSEMIPLK